MKRTVELKISTVENAGNNEVKAIMHADVDYRYKYFDKDGKSITEKRAAKLQEKGELVTIEKQSKSNLWENQASMRLVYATTVPDITEKLHAGAKVKMTLEFE